MEGRSGSVPPQGPNQHELFELLVRSATDFAIFTTDPAGLATSWNAGSEHLLLYSAEEMLGRSADVIFTRRDIEAGAPESERAAAAAAGRAEDERWHVRKDGSRFWGSGAMMPLADPAQGFVKILRDLTGRHAAERRLRESEELFRVLATNIPQLVFRTRASGARTWASPQWIDMTGVGFAESVGYGWVDAVHPDDRELTVEAWTAAQAEGEYLVEHRIRRASDGQYRWHQTRARPIVNGEEFSGEWVGTSADIHDLRELQDRQAVILAELQHRTRNLLAVVQAIARQTLRSSPSLQAFGGEFGERLGALGRVQSMLARADQHALDLRALIEAELKAHGDGMLGTDRVRMEGPQATVPAGAAQALALALHELATNAVKYGALAQASGRLEVTWRREEGDQPLVMLDWRETGVSMSDPQERRKGYGSELIERALPYQLKTKTRLEFAADGVRCEITVPVADGAVGESHA